jgi:hypothetical protein
MVMIGPISLLFEDECRVPFCKNSSFWSRKISEVVRHHCDLHYDRWYVVPASVKQTLKALVMVRLSLFMCIMSLATNNVTMILPFFS